MTIGTAWDLEPFARDCGYAGPPFRWDEARRCLLRAELDAAFLNRWIERGGYGFRVRGFWRAGF